MTQTIHTQRAPDAHERIEAPPVLKWREKQVLNYALEHYFRHRQPPSVRDYVRAFDWCSSTSVAHRWLMELTKKGYMRAATGSGRGFIPVRDVDGVRIEIVFRRADGVEVVA